MRHHSFSRDTWRLRYGRRHAPCWTAPWLEPSMKCPASLTLRYSSLDDYSRCVGTQANNGKDARKSDDPWRSPTPQPKLSMR
eukprot:scaffold1901_cov26-Tisochrysis_lutea.AAC.2